MQLVGSILTYVGGSSSSCMISFHDQFFDDPSALCLALWAKIRILLGVGVGETAWGEIITKGVGLSHSSGAA